MAAGRSRAVPAGRGRPVPVGSDRPVPAGRGRVVATGGGGGTSVALGRGRALLCALSFDSSEGQHSHCSLGFLWLSCGVLTGGRVPRRLGAASPRPCGPDEGVHTLVHLRTCSLS